MKYTHKMPEDYFAGEAFSALFNKNIEVMFYDKDDLDFADSCVQHFNALSEHIIDKLCECSVDYRNSFNSRIGKEDSDIINKREILTHIEPIVIEIEGTDEAKIGYRVELNFSWEVEHGMEWVIRNDSVLYVGPYEGIDVWAEEEFYKNLSVNFAYGKGFSVKKKKGFFSFLNKKV